MSRSITTNPPGGGALSNALHDVREGLGMRRLWMSLALEDMADHHRRTTLGPFWLLVNYAAYTATFTFIFHRGPDTPAYAAYVAVGLLVWFHIMESLTLGVSLFFQSAGFIQGTRLPLTVHIMRLTMQQMMRTGYAVLGCAVILAIARPPLYSSAPWALVGVVIVIVTTPIAICVVAFLGVFIADSTMIATNVTRIGMFVTPIFWVHREESKLLHNLYRFNPFTYYVEVIRAPIIGGTVSMPAIWVSITCTGFLLALSVVCFGRLRSKVVFAL